VWGQNPAVTEPNQSKIREGFYNLDTLVVVDMFENESAAVDRKPGGVTYLIPACSHAEEAGSVVNSGRVLQWRERVTPPKGNSKADLELLFRFAKAFSDAGAFSHITDQWAALTASIPGGAPTDAYAVLYGDRYGWTPGTPFEDVSGEAEIWRGADAAPSIGTVYGSEWIAELMYREMCISVSLGGTSWLWVDGYQTNYTGRKHPSQPADWQVYNRSKSRNPDDPGGTLAFGAWGYAWLVNRRILYGNGDPALEVGDGFQGPDKVGRLFVTTNTGRGRAVNYATGYRFYHRLSDKPDTGIGDPHVLPGRFPAHVEPYETPREDLAGVWGRNTRGGVQYELVPGDTDVAAPGRSHDPAKFPLVLTTIRCVEHFQGGPITSNNPWNVEAEPKPWIEINSVDAMARGIRTGDKINVITARSNSTTQQDDRTVGDFTEGFIARVGVGAEDNQRVGVGVVAIPWHWGDRGLSTGSRANDLCIDAGDANTTIPEYKACLCEITKDLATTPADL
jgi:formate dehydrogenase major subunit